jgi:hypothetical protein
MVKLEMECFLAETASQIANTSTALACYKPVKKKFLHFIILA